MRNSNAPAEPTRTDKINLSKELQKRFGFTEAQSRYLAINSFGYCNDTVNQIKKIERSMNSLKKVLEDMEI